jgi:hypothetical protein
MSWAFLRDAGWRAFRTFCQALAGLLVTAHVSNAFNAPWVDLVGASLLAGLTSLLMSVDRSTVTPVTEPAAAASFTAGCGTDLR